MTCVPPGDERDRRLGRDGQGRAPSASARRRRASRWSGATPSPRAPRVTPSRRSSAAPLLTMVKYIAPLDWPGGGGARPGIAKLEHRYRFGRRGGSAQAASAGPGAERQETCGSWPPPTSARHSEARVRGARARESARFSAREFGLARFHSPSTRRCSGSRQIDAVAEPSHRRDDARSSSTGDGRSACR